MLKSGAFYYRGGDLVVGCVVCWIERVVGGEDGVFSVVSLVGMAIACFV